MKEFRVGIIGATGMVGQRFITLLEGHPWFTVTTLAASARSAGRAYAEAVEGRWAMSTPIPPRIGEMKVLDASADMDAITAQVDFVFCAVDMKKEEIRALEEAYAKRECPVMSNNSAHRGTLDVPMLIPEVNAAHAQVIEAQRQRLGTKRGFIAVKSNCSLQSYLPALHPLMDLGLEQVLACTYQAISGAGKTFATWPEMQDNVIPYIGGKERAGAAENMGPGGGRPHCPRLLPRHHHPVHSGAGFGRAPGGGVLHPPGEGLQGGDSPPLAGLRRGAPNAGPSLRPWAVPPLL